ncbi:MAG TPA: hypothetical protein VD866_23270 [Urbifossiella sp.]|nr:hypothetical protein [Urbifossiella sp.]
MNVSTLLGSRFDALLSFLITQAPNGGAENLLGAAIRHLTPHRATDICRTFNVGGRGTLQSDLDWVRKSVGLDAVWISNWLLKPDFRDHGHAQHKKLSLKVALAALAVIAAYALRSDAPPPPPAPRRQPAAICLIVPAAAILDLASSAAVAPDRLLHLVGAATYFRAAPPDAALAEEGRTELANGTPDPDQDVYVRIDVADGADLFVAPTRYALKTALLDAPRAGTVERVAALIRHSGTGFLIRA